MTFRTGASPLRTGASTVQLHWQILHLQCNISGVLGIFFIHHWIVCYFSSSAVMMCIQITFKDLLLQCKRNNIVFLGYPIVFSKLVKTYSIYNWSWYNSHNFSVRFNVCEPNNVPYSTFVCTSSCKYNVLYWGTGAFSSNRSLI